MSDVVYRKCPNCGTLNLNKDYCQKCGELINTSIQRKEEQATRVANIKKKIQERSPNKVSLFFERIKKHPNIMVRGIAKFFYSIWVVVLAIGGIIALIIAYVAA